MTGPQAPLQIILDHDWGLRDQTIGTAAEHRMQRRMHRALDTETPPKSPFIRPNLSSTPKADGILTKKNITSTARIWTLVVTFSLLFAITRLFSSKEAHSHSFYDQDALHPVNYLNQSNLGVPFDFCPVHGSTDVIGNKYGAHAMAKSRLHLGSGAHIQRLIHRVSIAGLCLLGSHIDLLIFCIGHVRSTGDYQCLGWLE